MDRVRNEITNLQKQLTQKDSQITTMQSQVFFKFIIKRNFKFF